ncbi:LOW QUALITY PROTEIN: platelet-activating factor receptor-like [Lethenteron reissneri]|uniref:LOW QUALITY PROTEIN: platelet-activating factor receptor-like n=1 Tax=Lethenteron reissneri TaxID=7753 RepID=UPI002AB65869|nr:LOW QUALITY PROTEIN: platelet-activating factor receptor-like [Lethenteron reissneri]
MNFLSDFVILPIYVSTVAIGLPLNMVVCWVLGPTKKNSMSIYVVNLAIADLFYLMVLPMKIVYIGNGGNWIFPSFLCRVTTLIFFTNIYASIMILAAISVDRYKAVVHPLEMSRWREPRTAWIVCAVIWVITIAEIAPINSVTFTTQINATNGSSSQPFTKCYETFTQAETDYLIRYRMFLFFSLFVTSLAVMLFSYINVIKALIEVRNRTETISRDKKKRAVKLTVLVLVVFLVCFTPYNVSHVIGFVQSKSSTLSWRSLALLRDVVLCLIVVNGLFDPLIAYIASTTFRESFKNIWKCAPVGAELLALPPRPTSEQDRLEVCCCAGARRLRDDPGSGLAMSDAASLIASLRIARLRPGRNEE